MAHIEKFPTRKSVFELNVTMGNMVASNKKINSDEEYLILFLLTDPEIYGFNTVLNGEC